jgi:putative ABC transport system permease protein
MSLYAIKPGPPHRESRFSTWRARRTVELGMKSIMSHGLRSFLTVLGMVFGVSSVIAMLAVGEGASHEAQEQLRQLGSNNIIVKSVKPADVAAAASRGRGMPAALDYGLTHLDIDVIRKSVPGVVGVVPARIIRDNVWHLDRSVDADIMGTTIEYPVMRNYAVQEGRFFTQEEDDARLNVCVLGDSVARQLFPISNPIGKSVKIGGDYYSIVGIMEPGGFSNVGENEAGGQTASPNRIFIPLTAAKYRFGETLIRQTGGSIESETVQLHEATLRVADQSAVIQIGEIVKQILQRRHKNKDFEVEVPLALLRQAEASARMFNIVLGAIAAISLLVGGIGIMNIMLASVTERTREIGIRRALGARQRDIIQQFLVETVLLAGTGGAIGVAIGITVPYFITVFSDMQTIVTLWAPIVAFSISAVVGIVFGIYPAMRAAQMDPVEALRHE